MPGILLKIKPLSDIKKGAFVILADYSREYIATALAVKTENRGSPAECDRTAHAQTLQLRPTSKGDSSHQP